MLKKIILPILIIIAGFYYSTFFVRNKLPYTFKTNGLFFQTIYKHPVFIIKTLTPFTPEYDGLRPAQGRSYAEYGAIPVVVQDSDIEIEKEEGDAKALQIARIKIYKDVLSHSTSILHKPDTSIPKWFWELDVLVGEFVSKDTDNSIVGIDVSYPIEMTQDTGTSAFLLNCSDSSSLVIDKTDLTAVEVEVNVISSLTKGDSLYSYCMDSECSTLGSSCAIVR